MGQSLWGCLAVDVKATRHPALLLPVEWVMMRGLGCCALCDQCTLALLLSTQKTGSEREYHMCLASRWRRACGGVSPLGEKRSKQARGKASAAVVKFCAQPLGPPRHGLDESVSRLRSSSSRRGHQQESGTCVTHRWAFALACRCEIWPLSPPTR